MQAEASGALSVLESLPIAAAMRHDLWLYPAVEIVHISGFVVLVGSIAVLDLRLLGLSRGVPIRALTRHVVPWALGAALVIVPSGVLMFVTHASDFIVNRAFQLKLLLIVLAAANAALFHTRVYRVVDKWDNNAATPPTVKVHAAASLVLWVSVIACGRLIAYV
jgi:hypothetical protein